MGRFETKWLTAAKNLSALGNLSGRWIERVHARRPQKGILLDMDSGVRPTHGEQETSVCNGHYQCTGYHRLFVFNQFGDLERCALRPGNVDSADGWQSVPRPVVARYRGKVSRISFRADAGFANPEVYEYREAERINYAIWPYVAFQMAEVAIPRNLFAAARVDWGMGSVVARLSKTTGKACLDDGNLTIFWRLGRLWTARTPVRETHRRKHLARALQSRQVFGRTGPYRGNVG